MPPALGQRIADQPAPQFVVPVVPGDLRRHRPGGVRGEHAEQGVGVTRLERVRVPFRQARDPPGAERPQLGLLAHRRKRRPGGGTGPLQRAVHRRHRGPQLRGHLGRGETEDVAEDEHRALERRQFLQHDHERELHALSLLIPCLGCGGNGGQPCIRAGLQPYRIADQRLAFGCWRGGGPEADGQLTPGLAAHHVERGVGGDRVQPGAQRAAPLEPREAPPRPQQRVLHGVLGVLHRAEHPVAVCPQLPVVCPHQLDPRALVAGPR